MTATIAAFHAPHSIRRTDRTALPEHLIRNRVRGMGARALDFMGRAYAPPAGLPDDALPYCYPLY
jgi:hypothetical protein